MKSNTILVLSLVLNAVLLGTVGYINTLNVEPYQTTAIIRYLMTNAPPAEVTQALNPAPDTDAALGQPQ